HDFGGFQTVTRDAYADAFIARDAAAFDQFDGRGEGRAAGGFRPDALQLREQLVFVHDFLIRCACTPAARVLDFLYDVEAGCRIADGDRLGDRPRLLRADQFAAGVNRLHYRVASCRLRRINLRSGILDNSEFDELLIRLIDLGQDRSAGRWHHGVLG